MNITQEQYEANIRKAKVDALRATAKQYRAKAKALSETPGYGDRTLYHVAYGTILDLADELDSEAVALDPR